MTRSHGAAFEQEHPIGRQPNDPVLSDLNKVERDYRAFRWAYERQVEELRDARKEIKALRREAERQHKRAERLRHVSVDIHKGAFHGDVCNLVLRSCLSATGAERGIFLLRTEPGFRIIASVGIGDATHGEAPSPFMDALARRVLEVDDAVVAPASDACHETCAAMPVSMHGTQRGVLVVLDKRRGKFDEADLDTLLYIGAHATVALDNAQLQRELEDAYLGTVGVLADAVGTKDPYTHGHCEAVSHFALGMTLELGLDARTRETICLAALLHDVGKICISDDILNKPGPLLPTEREVVKTHARIGAELMRNLPALDGVAKVVLHHHEHFDGGGYPAGLAGDAIPIGSRIVAVIDAYCAMIDCRSYKQSMSEAETRAELIRCAGTQFDPVFVDAFLRVLDSDREAPGPRPAGCGILPYVRQHRQASSSGGSGREDT